MAIIKSVRGFTPEIGKETFLAETATIIGDVKIGENCSIWFNAVLRGDVNSIRIGNNVNIQDGAILHTLYQKSVIEIGDNVSIAHNAVIHGAKICNNVLIGIGAILLDHAVVGENSIVAAGAIVLSGTIIEPGSIYGGNPAKKIKDIDPSQTHEMIDRIANNYRMYAGWYNEGTSHNRKK
jgi:carbonic anhydrase/acetyltransferase-like protein (isoleucine patch superfamily)